MCIQGGGGGVLRRDTSLGQQDQCFFRINSGARKHQKEGGGGLGPKILCTQKWPDKIFPIANFIFPPCGHLGLGWGGCRGGGSPPCSCGVQSF